MTPDSAVHLSRSTTSAWRRNVAAAVAGIVVGGLAGVGVVSASGGGRSVLACTEPGTGAVLTGVDCRPAGQTPLATR